MPECHFWVDVMLRQPVLFSYASITTGAFLSEGFFFWVKSKGFGAVVKEVSSASSKIKHEIYTLQICTVFPLCPLSTVILLYGLHLIALYSPK